MPSGVRLDGLRGIVTGANSGIGLETSRSLLACGADVIASDLTDGDGLSALADLGATVRVCDVASAPDRDRLAEVADEYDFLVNSAGIVQISPVDQVTESDWDRVFGVNAKALFFLIQRVGPHLRHGGAIVNLSSIAARRAVNVESAVYAASKAAVLSITRSFAHAYASRDIRVNSLLPGLIDTPMQERLVSETAAARGTDVVAVSTARESGIPFGRLGSASEVAQAILWLVSPSSAYMTGQVVAVDGGLTMY